MVEPSGHCPYLGLKQNQAIRFASPTPEHRCYAGGQAQEIPTTQADYQASFCLSPGHVRCPLYTGMGLPTTPPVAGATPRPEGAAVAVGGLRGWLSGLAPRDRAIYGALLALLGVILIVYAVAGFGLLSGGSIFDGGPGPLPPATEGPSASPPPPAASDTPAPSDTPTRSPTRAPSATARATATASATASASVTLAPTPSATDTATLVPPTPTATLRPPPPPPPPPPTITNTPSELFPITDTPAPPTSEPSSTVEIVPTAEPPTPEPPTPELPTPEPPTAEPPTAEPPTAEPPTAEPTPEVTQESRRTPDPAPPPEG